MKVFSFLLPLVTCMQVKDVEENFLHAQAVPDMSSIREMLHSYAENAGKIDEVTAGAISALLTNLNTTIFEALYADRAIAQKLLDDAIAAVELCNTNRTNSFNGEISDLNVTLNETYEDLVECKFNETSTGGTSNETCEDQVETCDAQDTRVRTYSSHACGDAPQDGLGDSDAVFAWFECVDNFTTHHCDEYETGHEECEDAIVLCDDAVQNDTDLGVDCDTHQGDFESETCELAAAINVVCDRYDGCYDVAHHAWEEAVNAANEMWVLFTAQMQALEQILCFGNAIINNYTDYDHCEEDNCNECPNMGLTVLSPHDKKDCTEADAMLPLPCDQGWMTANYGAWVGNVDTAMAACTACPDVPITTTPTTTPSSTSYAWTGPFDGVMCAIGSPFGSMSAGASTVAMGKIICGALADCHAFAHVDADGAGPIAGLNTYYRRCNTPHQHAMFTTLWVKSPW